MARGTRTGGRRPHARLHDGIVGDPQRATDGRWTAYIADREYRDRRPVAKDAPPSAVEAVGGDRRLEFAAAEPPFAPGIAGRIERIGIRVAGRCGHPIAGDRFRTSEAGR